MVVNSRIVDFVREAARQGVDTMQLSGEDVARYLSAIRKTFVDPESRGVLLWDRVRVRRAASSEARFELVREFFADFEGECVLIMDDIEGFSGLVVSNARMIPSILAEMYGFVWYATSPELDVLLCSGDHDVVIEASGAH